MGAKRRQRREAGEAVRLVLRTTEAADTIAVGEDELRTLLRSGEIAAYQTSGGHWRIPVAALRAYTERRCAETAADRPSVMAS